MVHTINIVHYFYQSCLDYRLEYMLLLFELVSSRKRAILLIYSVYCSVNSKTQIYMKKITQILGLRWCSLVKHFALSRRRSRVQIPAGAISSLSRLSSPLNFLMLLRTYQNTRRTVTIFIVLHDSKIHTE